MMVRCPYPACLAWVTDAPGAWEFHFRIQHRREIVLHDHEPHQINRVEICKFCPLLGVPFGFYAQGCKHKDLGVAMLAHIAAYHPDRVVGLNLERERLLRLMKGRQN